MTCAACSARVEKAVSAVEGVSACSVNLLMNTLSLEGSAPEERIRAAVEAAGYGLAGGSAPAKDAADALEDRETPRLRRRLLVSLGFLLALMYLSMGHGMLHWPVPAFFDGNPVAVALAEMLLALTVMLINRRFFENGLRGLLHRSPNMDTLVAMGSSVSFLYSLALLFQMTAAGPERAKELLHSLYFESAAMILTLITVGKMLEARSKGKTTDAIRSLMSLAPETACRLEADGTETVIPAAELKPGDRFAVRPGATVPVDGTVLEGESAVNEAALTGESVPAEKGPGDAVSAATINCQGYLVCRADRVGEDTALSRIIRMVSDAVATKAPIAKIADKVSGIFVPAVMGIAALTLIIWLCLGRPFGFALARGISVLVISCPCALGLATPVAIMAGSGVGARHGILFRTAEALETAGKCEIAVLDKTGTVTTGEPKVISVLPAEGVSETELLRMAAALESRSEHPLAKAILRRAREESLEVPEAENFLAQPGNGLTGEVNGERLAGGRSGFIQKEAPVSPKWEQKATEAAARGETSLFFARGGKLLGLITTADGIRPESREAISQLHGLGLKVVLLTGDRKETAEAIGREAGADEVIAGVLPDGKEAVIRSLKRQGPVLMAGDGINDAPALTRADTGMAVASGTDIAIDSADVVLMNSRLTDVPAALRLSRATLKNIRENLFWAFFYNIIGIPLAAGVWIPLFGWEMNPMFGAAAMSLSSFLVVSNALRLNLKNIRDPKHDRKIRKKERKTMEKTMKIEGMMCIHCEARVKKVLEELPQVDEAVVSHEAGTAVLTLNAPVSDEVLRKAVEDQGYKVL